MNRGDQLSPKNWYPGSPVPISKKKSEFVSKCVNCTWEYCRQEASPVANELCIMQDYKYFKEDPNMLKVED